MGEIEKNPKLYQVRDKGQITLPPNLRDKYHLNKGALFSIEDTGEGIVITPKAAITLQALKNIGRLLNEKGITLDEMMESGGKIREELYEEMYGDKTTKGE